MGVQWPQSRTPPLMQPVLGTPSGRSYRQAIQTPGALSGRHDKVTWFTPGTIVPSGKIVRVAGATWRLMAASARVRAAPTSSGIVVDILAQVPGAPAPVSVLDTPLTIAVGQFEATGGTLKPSARILPIGTLVSQSPGTDEALLVVQSNIGASPSTYERDTATLSGSLWTKQEDGDSISQDNVTNVKVLGDNHYRILSQLGTNITYSLDSGQLQRSPDGGLTWNDVGPTPKESNNRFWGAIDVAIAIDGTLWLITTGDVGNSEVGFEPEVWKSVDDGATWTFVWEETVKRTFSWQFFLRIMTHPTDSDIIAIIGDTAIGIASSWHTEDGAAPFSAHTGSAAQSVSRQRSAVIWDNGRVAQIVSNNAYVTDNYGETDWVLKDDNILSVGQFVFSHIIGSISGHAYVSGGASTTPEIVRTRDYGETWETICNEDDFPVPILQLISLSYDSPSDTLYIATSSIEAGGSVNMRVFALDRASTVLASSAGSQTVRNLSFNLDNLFNERIAPRGLTLNVVGASGGDGLTTELNYRTRAVAQ